MKTSGIATSELRTRQKRAITELNTLLPAIYCSQIVSRDRKTEGLLLIAYTTLVQTSLVPSKKKSIAAREVRTHDLCIFVLPYDCRLVSGVITLQCLCLQDTLMQRSNH